MTRQLIFAFTLLVTFGVFAYTINRIFRYFKFTKANFPIRDIGKRFEIMFSVGFGQTKIFRKPVLGFLHALVFWGFCVILIGSIEMIIDGLIGTERMLAFMGPVYDVIMASGDIFALLVAIAIIVFLFRRIFLHIKRFEGIEMKWISHIDANVALTIILLLMLSLIGMNIAYLDYQHLTGEHVYGAYPVSRYLTGIFSGLSQESLHIFYEVFWWSHILLIFIFANMLPYSKHFHVFMSIPNVFLSRLEPLGKLDNMDNVTKEVKLMLDPNTAFAAPAQEEPIERFGVKDVEDISWKNYFDSLACTECGRCTSVCPANLTGKKLSPRKIMMDVRARMKEKGPGMIKNGRDYSDQKSLLKDYISVEELWACTTCNACAKECPININQPSLILDLRRFLVMEEAYAPGGIKSIFSTIENNGAPWQFSPEDRLQWAENLKVKIPVMADLSAKGEKPEFLFWVGCAGAFDDRYRKVALAFTKLLIHMDVSFAVLGKEETCTGDPARRAGNEMLFQMQALQNIEIFNTYGINKILTICPHCYNTFKNEYPDVGGDYEVVNYLQFLDQAISNGSLKVEPDLLKDLSVTFHDPCYLGRANDHYKEPRSILHKLTPDVVEMERHKSFALCCGAGGGQYFKEAEKGDKEIFIERTEEALATNADVIATACPFCMTMMTDGLKYKNKEEEIRNLDVAELVVQALDL